MSRTRCEALPAAPTRGCLNLGSGSSRRAGRAVQADRAGSERETRTHGPGVWIQRVRQCLEDNESGRRDI